MAGRINDYTQGSVARNIINMALPMTMAQLINVLYSVVDRMYIGWIPGTQGIELTGLGLTLPIITILMGFANLCGMGGGPLCSIHRGRGEDEEAEYVMGNSFVLLLILGAASAGLIFALKEPMLWLFGASPDTFPYANAYLSIYLLGTPFVMISLGMNPFINAQGFGKMGMMTVALGAVVNIVLDPIFIFVFHMGVEGAAWATIIAQGCSAVWVLRFLTGGRAIMRLRRRCFRLQAARVRRILALGLSGFFVNLTNSLVQVVCNTTLAYYGGDPYVGVMTVLNSIREVLFMPVQGLNNGAQPVVGYNYGARSYSRVCRGIRFTVAVTVVYSMLVWLLTMLLPGPLIRMFNGNTDLGIPAMRIYFCLFVFMSLQVSSQAMFVALGRSKSAIFFSLLRKAIINAPLTVILAYFLGTDGVFTAEAASQLLGGLASSSTMFLTAYLPLHRLRDGDDPPTLHHRPAEKNS